ncbi:MAG: hypothetical protein ABW166_04120 [Sedimenticola sp.]
MSHYGCLQSHHPEIEGLFINSVQYRNDVVLDPASARLVVDILVQRPPSILIALYAFGATHPEPSN